MPVGAGGGGRLTASGAASCSNLDRKLLTAGILLSSISKGSIGCPQRDVAAVVNSEPARRRYG
jgi:hypothetical protein